MHKNVSGHRSGVVLPLSPALDSTLVAAHMPRVFRPLDRRVLWVTGMALLLGVVVGLVAKILTALIGLITIGRAHV